MICAAEAVSAQSARRSRRRDGIVVATKGGYGGSGSSDDIRAQIEQSLESLKMDVNDLYYD
jgi:aryl-alcohol dehydrogenase-like predicted oxidoreductase